MGHWSPIFLDGGIVQGPVTGVLFRPEEVHTGSTPRPFARWASYLTVCVADYGVWLHGQHLFLPHNDLESVPTIETGGIDPNRFAWE